MDKPTRKRRRTSKALSSLCFISSVSSTSQSSATDPTEPIQNPSAKPSVARNTIQYSSKIVQKSVHGKYRASTSTFERHLSNEEVSSTTNWDDEQGASEESPGARAESPGANAESASPSPGNVALDPINTDVHEVFESPLQHPLQTWASDRRQVYLEELYRLDGRSSSSGHCCAGVHCENEGQYRCVDCFDTRLYCATCILWQHSYTPLHRVEVWQEDCFTRTSLCDLGLVIQLGHYRGEQCALPSSIRKGFYVIDTSGIHVVSIRFCGCRFIGDDIQLLRYRWYPGSSAIPRTAFTLDLLNTFHLITLQGKLSAYDFYLSIERKTNNAGIKDLQSRYDQFLSCMRQYRHLRMLKRAGLGMDTVLVSSTKPGSYAVECPACPHPGINLPDGWESEAEATRWLYGLNLTIDANFRLKNKDRSLEKDMPLGDGWGHWVSEGPYKDYLEANSDEPEPNLCDSELRAVDHANKRRSQGYVSTGVAGVICARHGLVRRNGLGNLQKGERYANTDFIVLSTLKDHSFARLVLSYDICCQWSRNLWGRIAGFPEDMRLSPEVFDRITFVIPKFHLYGHGDKCQTAYSLSYLPWSAETDGEDPERWWSHINPVSMSTKIMGPGSRADTIDDHAAAWNWRKIVNLGKSLLGHYQKAVLMSARHAALHAEYSAEFSEADLTAWKQMIVDWETDRTNPNPFEEKEKHWSMADIRLELAREEVTEPARIQSVGTNEFLYKGLELEELQRVIAASVKEKTTLQAAELQERRNNLGHRIELWRVEQVEHMPSISSDLERRAGPTPEKISLLLPSQIPATPELASIRNREARIRLAQADDALVELRQLLRITAGLAEYKYTQVGFAQAANTRTRSQINRFKDKVSLTAQRYRAAYEALLLLNPQGDWITRLRRLNDADIRWPGRDQNEAEGTREISWIWRSSAARASGSAPSRQQRPTNQSPFQTLSSQGPPISSRPAQSQSSASSKQPPNMASASEIGEALRVEWAKSHARAARWDEEVSLVLEEMRRVAVYLDWKAQWWRTRREQRSGASSELQEGINAYASRQSKMLSVMRAQFAAAWLPNVQGHNMALQQTST
ncbi:CxC2-like cysteine cluster KDZ transposase-associated domain-containing protein [Pleurotus pulmonarius]